MRLLLVLFLLIFAGCDQFHYSPFEVSNDQYHLNSMQLSELNQNDRLLGRPYKVAFISDTHNDYSSLQSFVNFINSHAKQYAFVIHSGDLTTFSTEREFSMAKRILGGLTIPFFVTAGNHDLIANGSTLFRNFFDSSEFSFSYQNSLFVLFSNNNWEDRGAPNLSWVESVLNSSTDVWKVLVTHIPPRQAERFSAHEIEKLESLTDSYGVDYIVSGHIHSDGFFGDFTSRTRSLDAGHTTALRRFKVLTFDGVSVSESTVSY